MNDSEMRQIQMQKIDAEIAKLIAETTKLNKESVWYPLTLAIAMVVAIIGLTKIVF